MKYRVLKFGGSSVANATAMSRVLDIVEAEALKGKVILVSSAISGCTDALLTSTPKDIEDMQKRHGSIVNRLFTGKQRKQVQARIDAIFADLEASPQEEKVTFGEILSTTILALKLEAEGYNVKWLDSRELVIKDDIPQTYKLIAEAVQNDAEILVAPGFICSNSEGQITTLGRGGSDYSAALYAAAVQAESLQIWTDVPGVMTANPRQVPSARTIPVMSYTEAFTMADSGAKVLYAPTVAPAMEAGIGIEIRNTFAPDGAYTVIGRESAGSKVGVASCGSGEFRDLALVGTITDDVIADARAALLEAGILPVSVTPVDGKCVFQVREAVEEKALRAIHNAFFEALTLRDIPVFIAGFGAVGKALADLIGRGSDSIARRTGKRLFVAGIGSSRWFSVELSGLSVLEPSIEGNFVEQVLRLAPRGAVFVDATSSTTIWQGYEAILGRGINIVSSNRRSLSVPYADYAAMKAAARENGVFLRYETTVGAALPILESIARGTNSSDQILSLEAVVSCTLNRIFDEYIPGAGTFASLVYRAWTEGLTETNPALDLGGEDALRKLLILVREAGVHLDRADVSVEPLIPDTMMSLPPDEFFAKLEGMEPVFSSMAGAAASEGKKLRFVASYEGGLARISVESVPPEHPAYFLKGTENAIIVCSAMRPYPLLIKGPGEGALEAASSILNDILR